VDHAAGPLAEIAERPSLNLASDINAFHLREECSPASSRALVQMKSRHD
jgi:hypothetical protein